MSMFKVGDKAAVKDSVVTISNIYTEDSVTMVYAHSHYSGSDWYSPWELEPLHSIIDDQTIMFWTLQLQFMELDGLSVEELYKSIRHSPLYVKNEFTRKLDKIIDSRDDFSEDDRLCIITHVALQLSGLA